MEMINKTIIKQYLKDLEIVIRELRKYQNRPLVDFENDIIPIEFARKIRGMASFRNILVHEYATIDLEKLHQILNNNLVDFEEFIKYTISYLKM